MLAPMNLRTGATSVGMPEWLQPITQSNSAGIHRGRGACQPGTTEPPTPTMASSW